MTAFVAPDVILHNGMYIPVDARNADYRALIASGVTIDPLPTVDPLVAWRAEAKVSRFQARAALLSQELLDDVEAAVAASGNTFAQLAWADAIEFRRNSETIANLKAAVGLSDAQLDALFELAAGIQA